MQECIERIDYTSPPVKTAKAVKCSRVMEEFPVFEPRRPTDIRPHLRSSYIAKRFATTRMARSVNHWNPSRSKALLLPCKTMFLMISDHPNRCLSARTVLSGYIRREEPRESCETAMLSAMSNTCFLGVNSGVVKRPNGHLHRGHGKAPSRGTETAPQTTQCGGAKIASEDDTSTLQV